jgi:hypothetical protein
VPVPYSATEQTYSVEYGVGILHVFVYGFRAEGSQLPGPRTTVSDIRLAGRTIAGTMSEKRFFPCSTRTARVGI